MCNFVTNTTAVTLARGSTPKSPEINFRMGKSSFSVTTSDKQTKVIYFKGRAKIIWKLWKTKFQINSYHTISSNKNFTKYLDKIVSYDATQTFYGTVSETQYASGNSFKSKCGIDLLAIGYNKTDEGVTFECKYRNLCSFDSGNQSPLQIK